MSKFLPKGHELVKGLIISAVSLAIITRVAPARRIIMGS